MHSMSHFWRLSRKIYGPRNAQENKRAVVFFFRAVTNRSLFEELYAFFEAYPPMQGFFETHDPDFQEVMTRVFLFKNSTMRQRLDALLHHFTILRSFFSDEVIHKIYWESGYTLWKSEDSTLPLEARLLFDTGQRKEGFLSLGLYHEQEMIYHFNFRFDYNADGIPSIYIGTLQGSKHGLDTTKALTKKLFGYRPKNFILYLLRIFIQTLGIHDFYVITDEGFYTNSHVLRGNRSKKTNFNDFWIDEGAVPDPREAWYFVCLLKKSAANTRISNPRNATCSASDIFSWIKSYQLIYNLYAPCSVTVLHRFPRHRTKLPYWTSQPATIQ